MLRESAGGIISELTPSALYDLFVTICKRRLHLIVAYDGDSEQELALIRDNPCLTKSSLHLVVQKWPVDALKKSSELILEDLSVDRNAKKALVESGIRLYEEAR